MAQLAVDVALVTLTVADAPPARSTRLQVRTLPARVQPPGLVLMLHVMPGPVGRVSVSTGDVAVPAPELVTLRV